MAKRSLDLCTKYILLDPTGKSSIWKADEFWKMAFDNSRKENHPDMGGLISSYEFSKDWDFWEKHPNGDEIVIVLSGYIEFILEEDSTVRIPLKTGETCIVPKGTWHTAKVKEITKVLFITYGYGTEHRSIADNN